MSFVLKSLEILYFASGERCFLYKKAFPGLALSWLSYVPYKIGN